MPEDEKKYSLAELAQMVAGAQSPAGAARTAAGQTDPQLAATAAAGPNLAEELLTLKAELAALKTGKAETARTPTPAPSPAPTPHPAPAGSTNPTIPGARMLDHSPSQARAYLASTGYNHRRPFTPESRAAAHAARKRFEAELDNVVITEPGEERRR